MYSSESGGLIQLTDVPKHDDRWREWVLEQTGLGNKIGAYRVVPFNYLIVSNKIPCESVMLSLR